MRTASGSETRPQGASRTVERRPKGAVRQASREQARAGTRRARRSDNGTPEHRFSSADRSVHVLAESKGEAGSTNPGPASTEAPARSAAWSAGVDPAEGFGVHRLRDDISREPAEGFGVGLVRGSITYEPAEGFGDDVPRTQFSRELRRGSSHPIQVDIDPINPDDSVETDRPRRHRRTDTSPRIRNIAAVANSRRFNPPLIPTPTQVSHHAHI